MQQLTGTPNDERAPFSTLTLAYNIDGTYTDIILSTYSNQLFFSITQLGTFGTIV